MYLTDDHSGNTTQQTRTKPVSPVPPTEEDGLHQSGQCLSCDAQPRVLELRWYRWDNVGLHEQSLLGPGLGSSGS